MSLYLFLSISIIIPGFQTTVIPHADYGNRCLTSLPSASPVPIKSILCQAIILILKLVSSLLKPYNGSLSYMLTKSPAPWCRTQGLQDPIHTNLSSSPLITLEPTIYEEETTNCFWTVTCWLLIYGILAHPPPWLECPPTSDFTELTNTIL